MRGNKCHYTLPPKYDKIRTAERPFYSLQSRRSNMRHLAMKEIPIDQRPYDKFEALGANALTEVELLAILLRSGDQTKNSLELAREILELPEVHGVGGLMNVSYHNLIAIRGIGKVKATQLLSMAELVRRILNSKNDAAKRVYSDPDSIAALYQADLAYCPVEQVWLTCLDTKNHLLAREMISQGTVNSSLVSPREIYLSAIKHGAVSIVLVHNHPSGDCTPSDEDIDLTLRTLEAGKNLGVCLLDHIVIGGNTFYSLKEHGVFK